MAVKMLERKSGGQIAVGYTWRFGAAGSEEDGENKVHDGKWVIRQPGSPEGTTSPAIGRGLTVVQTFVSTTHLHHQRSRMVRCDRSTATVATM